MDDQNDITITKAKKLVKNKIEICERYMNDFMEYAVKLCGEKIEEIVEERIIKEPRITKKQGPEGLQELLSKKENLLIELPDIVKKEASSAKIWKHIIISTKPEYENISNYFIDIYDFKRDIKKSLGRVLGYGVELLLEYDYLKNQESICWYKSEDNKIFYKEEIEFNHEMETIIATYLHSYHLLYGAFQNLMDLKLKKDRQEAENILKKVKESLK